MLWLLGIIVWGVASEIVEGLTGWSFTTSKVVTAGVVIAILVALNLRRSQAADDPASDRAVPESAPSVPAKVERQPERDARARAYLARRGVEVRDGETPMEAARRDIAERRAAAAPRRTFMDGFRETWRQQREQ